MIVSPNRLLEVRQALQHGDKVDYRKVANLQALDLVIAGRQFVEQAVLRQEAADAGIETEWEQVGRANR